MGTSEGKAPSLGQLLEMRWPRACLVMFQYLLFYSSEGVFMPSVLKATDYLKITTMNNKTYFCILKILHEMEHVSAAVLLE